MVQVIPEIQANKEQIVTWRRHFHQHPEPSLKEFKTAEKIQEILTDLNVPFEKVGETGTLGTITGTKNDATQSQRERKVLLRADIDALEITEATSHDFPSLNEGIMHACGHDAHNSGLLGAVAYLVSHREQFAGTVLVAFQQAEEIGSGAYQFIESGLLDGVGQVFEIGRAHV